MNAPDHIEVAGRFRRARDAVRSGQAVSPAGEIERLTALVLELQRDHAELRRDQDDIRRTLNIPKPVLALGEQWVALKFAADVVGFNAETVRLWALTGEIEAVKRGGRWFVNLPDVKRRAAGQGAASHTG